MDVLDVENRPLTLMGELSALVTQEETFQQQRMDTRKLIGVKLTELRLAHKLSFREAGELIGCDPGLLNRIEKGKAWAFTVVDKASKAYIMLQHAQDQQLPLI